MKIIRKIKQWLLGPDYFCMGLQAGKEDKMKLRELEKERPIFQFPLLNNGLMATKYHTRKGYESFLRNICRECKGDYPDDLHKYSNIDLLSLINFTLQLNKCIPFSQDELEDILDILS